MFVMLSVRTTTVCERQAETGTEKVTHLDNIYITNNNIEKTFTKSISFDKNINKSNLILTELNNFKQPPTLQVNDLLFVWPHIFCSLLFTIMKF